jgi:uncharacterized protein (TIGR02118 family)
MFVHRRPDLEFEAFRKHYEEVHAPLARSKFRFMRKYVRNFLSPSAENPPPCDCITELWFDDMETFAQQAKETGSDPEIEADEKLFMDRSRMTHYMVEEHSS